jgi:hypothetical protein
MKKAVLLILLISFSFNACTSFMLKYSNEPKEEYYTRINKTIMNENVSLKMISGKIYNAKDVLVNADTTIFYDLDSNLQQKAATNEIYAISYNNTGKGILHGFIIGTVIGSIIVFVPTLVDAAVNGDSKKSSFWYIALGALAGAAIGIICGYSNGSTIIIEMNK